MRLPTQANCDTEDPEQHLLWMLTQVPYNTHQPIVLPAPIAKAIAAHLHACGARHHPELQTKRMVAPHRGQQHILNGTARWVGMDDPEPAPVELPDVAAMTTHEQELMIQELKRLGRIQDPPPDRDTASVATLKRELP